MSASAERVANATVARASEWDVERLDAGPLATSKRGG